MQLDPKPWKVVPPGQVEPVDVVHAPVVLLQQAPFAQAALAVHVPPPVQGVLFSAQLPLLQSLF